MGDFVPDSRPLPPVDHRSWCPSDAVVNTVAQKAPTWAMNSAGQIYPRPITIRDLSHGGTPLPRVWNWKGLMGGFDHFDVIGWTRLWDSVGWYKARVDQLRSL